MPTKPAALKKTRQRQQVLDILKDAQRPMTASEIYQEFIKQNQPIALSTIYRILSAFCQNQDIVKTGQLDTEQSFYEIAQHNHRHYAICLDCRKIIPLRNCPLSSFEPNFTEQFYPTEHKIEIYGHCKDCFAQKSKSKKST